MSKALALRPLSSDHLSCEYITSLKAYTVGLDGGAVLDYDLLSLSYDELYGCEQMCKYYSAVGLVNLYSSDRVLDLGCGTGLFYDFLLRLGWDGEYVGVDLSAGMLERAKLRGAQHLIQADGHRLPFRDKTFTHLFSFTVIHHCSPQTILQEASRVTVHQLTISQNSRLGLRLHLKPKMKVGHDEIVTIQP